MRIQLIIAARKTIGVDVKVTTATKNNRNFETGNYRKTAEAAMLDNPS
jgi:hypothetical protein